MIEIFLIYAFNLVLGSAGAWFVIRFGSFVGLIDRPNDRSSHLAPTPKGGAIGVLVGFVVSAMWLNLLYSLWLPALGLALISLLGDRREIDPKVRLMIQFCCSLIFLVILFYSKNINFFAYFIVSFLAIYIVGTSNFYNFMDGINGIAGITGIVGFLLLAVFGLLTEVEPKYVTASFAIACSCLGFLPYNIPRAKVFMGDVGSILLGFVFACMVVIMSRSLLDFICLAGFLFPFYADELTTMVVRIRDGESLSKPHRRHLYQILANECGIEHWKISVGYGVVQLIAGIMLISFRAKWDVVLIFLILCFSLFSLVSAFFRSASGRKYFRVKVK
ncbi:MraY family glycosyltransferase [Desulfoluna limicola]|uniref:MraY family glycosyltransferase n=1 Tax=Desulfoluna limicola TaxID=2810562 RepID=UPI001F351F9B|nr:glycosyltransferase family 4 protein [Desulfoluna limicola]